ncbi:tetratricopeptide repeat protein [Novosphingobium sp. HR1a]|uniref:TPR repeat-containing protein n=2 Tax=Novosphingobium resinovorum TaxID=158500 RepID=A0A1D8A1L2_9SPHN|nr:tetratricopeptide repeat protein [Novosphingobium sp. HR1a]AOR75950.1 hypothetical protein BES08_03695 [Novosphingobium resinovorum]MBF7011328.1 tetratricopeptide repeat protein [Novosphingobium sp. HR1a]
MKSTMRIALPLVALVALAACGDSPETLYAKARDDFAAGNYQRARVEVASALKDRPTDAPMLALLVETQLRLGDPDGAEGAIGRLERAGGKDMARMKAEVALLRGDAKAALATLGNETSVDGWRVRAEAQLALGDEEAARDAFEKGMKAGGDIRLAQSYARYLLENGDLARAASLLGEMQRIAPRSYEALVMAGDLASAQGREEDAARAYRTAIDAFPDRAAPMLALAEHYDGLGKLDEASKLVDQAAEVAPDDPEVEVMRIQLLSEQGQWEKIRTTLQTRESELAAGSTLSMRYGEALLQLGHAEQARVIFRRAVLALPGNPYARLMLGESQLATGDGQGAWATLQPLAASTLAGPQVLEAAEQAARAVGAPEAAALQARLDPARLKETMALVGQGESAIAGQRWATAAGIYERLLMRGEDPEVLKRLAFTRSGLGEGDAAIRAADKAVALGSDNPDYLFVAGLVRVVAGRDLGEAQRLLEKAADLDPANRAIARELKKAKAAAG